MPARSSRQYATRDPSSPPGMAANASASRTSTSGRFASVETSAANPLTAAIASAWISSRFSFPVSCLPIRPSSAFACSSQFAGVGAVKSKLASARRSAFPAISSSSPRETSTRSASFSPSACNSDFRTPLAAWLTSVPDCLRMARSFAERHHAHQARVRNQGGNRLAGLMVQPGGVLDGRPEPPTLGQPSAGCEMIHPQRLLLAIRHVDHRSAGSVRYATVALRQRVAQQEFADVVHQPRQICLFNV